MTRTFSIVPARAGALRIDAPRHRVVGRARGRGAHRDVAARSTLQVAPGVGSFAASGARLPVDRRRPSDDAAASACPACRGAILPWALATVVFAVLWLRHPDVGVAAAPTTADSSATGAARIRRAAGAMQVDLKRALDAGDLGDIADQLCAMATPAAPSIDALRDRLDDAGAARGPGVAAARALGRRRCRMPRVPRMRAAFAQGPRWRMRKPAPRVATAATAVSAGVRAVRFAKLARIHARSDAMGEANARPRRKLPLHWKMAIGFVAGLLLGLVAYYSAGADAPWVQWLTTWITQPAATCSCA